LPAGDVMAYVVRVGFVGSMRCMLLCFQWKCLQFIFQHYMRVLLSSHYYCQNS